MSAPECRARVADEIAIVQPRIVVVMGEHALRELNELALPLARPVEAKLGEVQKLTPTIDALYVPDIDARARRGGRQARVLGRVPRARRLVRGVAAVLAEEYLRLRQSSYEEVLMGEEKARVLVVANRTAASDELLEALVEQGRARGPRSSSWSFRRRRAARRG